MTCVVARFTFFLNPAHDMLAVVVRGGGRVEIRTEGLFASRACKQFGSPERGMVQQLERIGENERLINNGVVVARSLDSRA